MRRISIIFLSVIIFFLISCEDESTSLNYEDLGTTISYTNMKSVEFTSPLKSTNEFDFEEVNEYFAETRSVINLEDIDISWAENDVYVSFYFPNTVEKNEIDAVMGFYSSVILSDKDGYYKVPHEIKSLINTPNTDNRILRIYIDDTLVIRSRHKFDKENRIIENIYFENNLMKIKQRHEITDKEMDLFNCLSSDNIKTFDITKAIKPFTIFVAVDLKKILNQDTNQIIEEIKESFEKNITDETFNQLSENEIDTIIFTYYLDEKILEENKVEVKNNNNLIWSTDIW